jgi:hypothetical protein
VFVLVTCIILHVTKCLEAISIFALVTMNIQKEFDWMLAFLRVVAHQVLKSALASRLVRGGEELLNRPFPWSQHCLVRKWQQCVPTELAKEMAWADVRSCAKRNCRGTNSVTVHEILPMYLGASPLIVKSNPTISPLRASTPFDIYGDGGSFLTN